MVSISRKTAKNAGTALRARTSTSMNAGFWYRYYEKEKMGLASLALTVGTLIAYWLFLTRNDTAMAGASGGASGSGSSLRAATTADQQLNARRQRQARIPELPTRYNGIAKDILQVLNCSQKLPTYYSWNDEMPGFRDDEVQAFGQGQGGGGGGGDFSTKRKDSTTLVYSSMNNNNNNNAVPIPNSILSTTSTTSTTTTTGGNSKTTKDWMDGADVDEAAAHGAVKEDHTRHRHRRLGENVGYAGGGSVGGPPPGVPGAGGGGGAGGGTSYTSTYDINAKHMFCLAAGAPDLPKAITANSFKCSVLKPSTRQALLDAWSAARAASMSESMLRQVLDVSVEQSRDLLGHAVKLWTPVADDGSDYVIKRLNKDVDAGGIKGLDANLGPGKVFVDVGSCLGLTALAVTLQYPGTTVVAIEPAAPNWFLMQMNLICNLSDDEDDSKRPHVVLGGVGESQSPNRNNNIDAQMAKMIWRSSSTTMTRAWTPAKERKSTDIDLVVALRRWDSILKDANVERHEIDVLNVDCQGCEYNLIPSLSDKEYEAISTVMGNLHWGYIPPDKLPSKQRGTTTHERLCKHENFARTAKECCAFPTVQVKSTLSGEALVQENSNNPNEFPPKQATVADVAGDLCLDFDKWAVEKHWNDDMRDDLGWFELTSMAAVDTPSK